MPNVHLPNVQLPNVQLYVVEIPLYQLSPPFIDLSVEKTVSNTVKRVPSNQIKVNATTPKEAVKVV